MLSVWHVRLAHANSRAIKWMAKKGAVRDKGMTKRYIPANCSPCNEGTIKSTLMRSHTHVKMQLGAVVHTDVAEMNDPSLGGARFSVASIDEAASYIKAFHTKTKKILLDY